MAATATFIPRASVGNDVADHSAISLPFDHSFRSEWAYSNYGIFLGQQSAAHAAGMSAPEVGLLKCPELLSLLPDNLVANFACRIFLDDPLSHQSIKYLRIAPGAASTIDFRARFRLLQHRL
jgi:hypothetical protein